MVDEHHLYEEMYNASVRRMDLQILCSKALSRRLAEVASKSGGDLDRAERWAVPVITLRSYVRDTVILGSIGKKAVNQPVILWLL
jgi:hypothetical protein